MGKCMGWNGVVCSLDGMVLGRDDMEWDTSRLGGAVRWEVGWGGSEWDWMVWYGMVWYGMGVSGMVWGGMGWYGVVWDSMAWYGMVWYGMG